MTSLRKLKKSINSISKELKIPVTHKILSDFIKDSCSLSMSIKPLMNIGGHKEFHLEGNAYIHTLLVYATLHPLHLAPLGLLHDVGKMYTSVRHNKHDWTYPYHSTEGGKRVHEFLSQETVNYFHNKYSLSLLLQDYEWIIDNHIRPMFAKSLDEILSLPNSTPERVKILLILVLADLKGSKGKVENNSTKMKIQHFVASLPVRDE